jgi:hypothetical protein
MKRSALEIAVYVVVVLIGTVLVVLAGLPALSAASGLLLNIGSSVVASAIVSFLILFFVGNPFEAIEKSLAKTSDDFRLSLERNISVLSQASRSGLIGVWSSRSDVEIGAWLDRLAVARNEVFILAFAMEFLSEHERFVRLLQEKGAQGCRVRLIMGDPGGSAVAERNKEERLEGSIRSRVETTLIRLEQIVDGHKVSLKVHNTPLYCAIYGFDDEIIVTPHLYGLRGAAAPALAIKNVPNGLYSKYKKHFEDIWQIAENPPRLY